MDNDWVPPDLAEWWAEKQHMIDVRTRVWASPQFQRYLQEIVQEAVLRYYRERNDDD